MRCFWRMPIQAPPLCPPSRPLTCMRKSVEKQLPVRLLCLSSRPQPTVKELAEKTTAAPAVKIVADVPTRIKLAEEMEKLDNLEEAMVEEEAKRRSCKLKSKQQPDCFRCLTMDQRAM